MVTMAAGAFLETWAPDFWLLCACTFLNSFGKWALFQVTLVGTISTTGSSKLYQIAQVYLMEAIGFERRLQRFPWISYNSLVTVTFFIPYCLGKIAATFVVHQMESWRQFERWIAVASCVQFLVVFLIPESPRWLLYHQRKYNSPTFLFEVWPSLFHRCYREDKVRSTLRSIARCNGRSDDIDVMDMVGEKNKCFTFLWYPRPSRARGFGVIKSKREMSVLEIFKPVTLPYTLAFIFGWPMITFLRFGVNNIGEIFESLETTNYIRGGLEISGLLLTAVIEGFMGRRCLLLTLLTSVAIAFFAISFPTLPIRTKKGLFWFINIPTTSANTLIILLTLCVYPTSLSSITIGLFTALSCIGEVVAPIAIDYVPFWYMKQDVAFFAMGLVALAGEKKCSQRSSSTYLAQELVSPTTCRRC